MPEKMIPQQPGRVEQILTESTGVMIFNLLKQIAILQAEVEKLRAELAQGCPEEAKVSKKR